MPNNELWDTIAMLRTRIGKLETRTINIDKTQSIAVDEQGHFQEEIFGYNNEINDELAGMRKSIKALEKLNEGFETNETLEDEIYLLKRDMVILKNKATSPIEKIKILLRNRRIIKSIKDYIEVSKPVEDECCKRIFDTLEEIVNNKELKSFQKIEDVMHHLGMGYELDCEHDQGCNGFKEYMWSILRDTN